MSTLLLADPLRNLSVDPALIPVIGERRGEFGGVQRADGWIRRRVLRLLNYDTTVNGHSIEVEVLEGKVMLSGTVTSSAERSVAESLAGRVPGVAAVDSRLIIERPR
jgi:osmotically-inducible protein OsmY